MRVAITGGAGFIGSHTVDHFLGEGAKVLVIDDQSHPAGPPPGSAENLVADCGSAEAAHAIRRFRPDAILHLASKGGVQRAGRDPRTHLVSSVASTVALFDAAARAGVQRVVTASSGGTLYGDAERFPTTESAQSAPNSAYGAGKLAEEGYLFAFARRYGFSPMALRYGNVYGPRQDGTGEAGLVAITCHRLLDGLSPIVYGDGRQTRDFTYVSDVVAANLLAISTEKAGVVNIGTGRETSVNDVVAFLNKHSTSPANTQYQPAREGEVTRVCLSSTRARQWLGWTHEVSIDRGLATTWEWFSAQRSLEGMVK